MSWVADKYVGITSLGRQHEDLMVNLTNSVKLVAKAVENDSTQRKKELVIIGAIFLGVGLINYVLYRKRKSKDTPSSPDNSPADEFAVIE